MVNGYGGKRSGAGRPKGSGKPLAVRVEARERREISYASREEAAKAILGYVNEAYTALVDVMTNGKSEPARVAAANSILDRGLGKPREAPPEPASDAMRDITPQGLNGSGHKPPIDLEDFRRVDR